MFNDRAIIFQRSSIGTRAAQETELAWLEAYADREGLGVMSVYVASGTPNMLTIKMLIDNSLAWTNAGHIVVADLNRLWDGSGSDEVIALLAYAGAIVHVVPPEAT